MNRLALQLYHNLPAPMRSVAASLRGIHLKSWRYGPETDELTAQAIERERWSPARLKSWQQERLAYVLNRAAKQVPYYREHWMARRRQGDHSSWEEIENWPILEKDSLRANPRAFVADDCDVRRMYHEQTSGTTGKSLDIWLSRKTVRSWYALFEARCRSWYGVTRNDRWAILGGQLVTSALQRKPPFWVWNSALNQLYMSSYHLAADLIPHYLDALVRYRIKYIWGYSSALYELALEAIRLKRDDLKMMVAITNAEPLFDYQRRIIAEAFQCSVRETYGMSEIAATASECQQARLHLWPEVGCVEVVDGYQHATAGATGDLVCTGLMNGDMPLIRYRVGDRGCLEVTDETCDCGRSLPGLASIEGRIDDLLYTTDGRRIGRLDPVFKSFLPVREAQIIQETLNRVRVRYVPTSDYTAEAGRSIIEGLQARMGPVEVVLESVDMVPRTANGKFRAVVCNLPPQAESIAAR